MQTALSEVMGLGHVRQRGVVVACVFGAGLIVLSYISAHGSARLIAGVVIASVLGLVALMAIARPWPLLAFAVVSAGLTGLLQGAERELMGPSQGLTLYDGLWFAIGAVALLGLSVRVPSWRVSRVHLAYYGFAVWAAARLLVGDITRTGIRDVLFYGLPAVLLTFAYVEGTRERMLRNVVLSTSVVMAGLYGGTIALGLVRLTPEGPYGIIDPRPTAVLLLALLPVALAEMRYSEGRRRTLGKIVAIVNVTSILFTLSRTASFCALFLLFVSQVRRANIVSWLARGGIGILVSLLILAALPQFRYRFFAEKVLGSQPDVVNLSGRQVIWPLVFSDALRHPIIGSGLGSARKLTGVALGRPKGVYSHNEYLQIFHDLGVVGLSLMLVVWVIAAWTFRKRWIAAQRQGMSTAGLWSMIGLLSVVPVMVMSVTDNPLQYAYFVGVTAIIWGLALRHSQIDGSVRRHGSRSAAG